MFDVLVTPQGMGAAWIAYRDSRQEPEPVTAGLPIKKATKRPVKKQALADSPARIIQCESFNSPGITVLMASITGIPKEPGFLCAQANVINSAYVPFHSLGEPEHRLYKILGKPQRGPAPAFEWIDFHELEWVGNAHHRPF